MDTVIPAGYIRITRPDGRQFDVPEAYVDWFYDGRTGELISDEEWDESMRRMRAHDPDFTVA